MATIVVGMVGGVNAVGGYLLGNIVTGLLLAFMSMPAACGTMPRST